METGPILEEANASMATALQEVIADEVKAQVKNAMAEILELVNKALQPLFSQPQLMLEECSLRMYKMLWNR